MKLFYGQFNYQGSVHKRWTYAENQSEAYRHLISQLSKRLGISNYKLRCYFNDEKPNFKILEK